MKTERRPYRQTARAERVQETRGRILDAGMELFLTRWFDEVTLGDLAREAGVSQQTVVNHFGGKAGVLLAVAQERMTPEIEDDRHRAAPGDVEGAIGVLYDSYEKDGDGVLRLLTQEERIPAVHEMAENGRRWHRAWVERTFEPGSERELVALVVATDLLVWKLLRREMGLDRDAAERIVADMVTARKGAP
jgi:AcrR family transcriptional regulator